MNSPTKYEDEYDRIKIYLKIKPSNASDKIFFNISKDKKVISLLDNITLEDPKKTNKIEIDKIFTNKEENSYIYEEIMRNCVKDSLDGENFTFISYGDSNSDKYQFMIGTQDCYENINNRGLLPRLLENYINKIDSNEILSDTISLNLSYIMINNNSIIDLAQLIARENKTFDKISKDEFFKKYSKEIKIEENNLNYLKFIKKIPVETAKDSLFFMLQFLNLFYKLESSYSHFLTWSYLIIILYVTNNDGKTVSTISFVLLPGNEILLHRFSKKKSLMALEKRDSLSISLKNNGIECNNVIEDIFDHLEIKQSKQAEENKINDNTAKKSIKSIKAEVKSKLFNIIGPLAFDVGNEKAQYDRRYIIIGSIFGNSGYITYTKDTLSFILRCRKFLGQKVSSKHRRDNFDNGFFKEKLKAKDDQIYDLESKLRTQESKVKELNDLMDSKEDNLRALQDNYKYQIQALKDEFGFHGDINNLLTQNKESDEYLYTVKIRNMAEKNKLKIKHIEELKNQIINIETDIKQLRNLLYIKQNDTTMLEMIRTVREGKAKKNRDMSEQNKVGKKIEELERKQKMLENKIVGYKNEIKYKKKLLAGLPDIFDKNVDVKLCTKNLNIKLDDNDNSKKWFKLDEEDRKNRIKTDNNSKKVLILNNYKSILEKNNDSIKDIKIKLDTINNDIYKEQNKYIDEMIIIYKNIVQLVNYYRKIFTRNASIFINKERFGHFFAKKLEEINPLNLPLLYNELENKNLDQTQISKKEYLKKNVIKSKYYKNIVKDEDTKSSDYNISKNSNSTKTNRNDEINKITNLLNNDIKEYFKEKNPLELNEEIIKEKEIIFSGIIRKTNGEIITSTINDLRQDLLKNGEKIGKIEDFMNSYFEGESNFSTFEPAKEKIKENKIKIKKIKEQIKELNEKYNNNIVVFEEGDKKIQKLINENNELRKKIYGNDKNNIFKNYHPNYKNVKDKFCYKNRNISLTNNDNHNFKDKMMEKLYKDSSTYKNSFKKDSLYLKSSSNRRPVSSVDRISPYYLVAEHL